MNVSELLQRYAFDEVIAAIDNGKADCTGAEASQIAATARLGADMLNATEKVTVLESRIVPLVDLLNHLPLKPDIRVRMEVPHTHPREQSPIAEVLLAPIETHITVPLIRHIVMLCVKPSPTALTK